MMFGWIDGMIFLGIVGCLVWAFVVWKWPGTATTPAGKAANTIVNQVTSFSAKTCMQLIRFNDDIEKNPEALDLWERLYAKIGGTPYSPDTPAVVIPPTIATPASSATADHVHFTP